MPSHMVFLSLIYPIVGVLLARMSFGNDLIHLLFPLTAGFALTGPFAAVGLYEMSRRRESGLDTSWKQAFDVLRPSIRAITVLAIVIFLCWLVVAHWLYHFVGFGAPESPAVFVRGVLTTSSGYKLILAGTAIGLLFGIVVLTISVVVFPILLDRNVGVAQRDGDEPPQRNRDRIGQNRSDRCCDRRLLHPLKRRINRTTRPLSEPPNLASTPRRRSGS